MIIFFLTFLLGGGLIALVLFRGEDREIFMADGPPKSIVLKFGVALLLGGLTGLILILLHFPFFVILALAVVAGMFGGVLLGGRLHTYLTQVEENYRLLYGEEHEVVVQDGQEEEVAQGSVNDR